VDGANGTDGVNGIDGYNSLTITDNVVGSSCDFFGNGGARIRSGSDINRNGVLEITEIEYIAFVCNGADGTDGTDGVDGTDGTNGVDGVDGADGVDGSDGLSSLMNISSEPNGPNCQCGGQKVEYGLDFNENGVLDIFEIIDAVFTCNGAPGADGSDGADGADGVDGVNGTYTALMITDEPVGVNCQHGGKKIESGPDADMDGIPDSVVSTVYSCNERMVYTPQGASSSVCGSFTAIAPSNADHCVFYDAVGGTLNFQGAASTIYVSTGWCASECFDVNGVRIATSVCTGVGFYNINQPTCTHDGK
jgi:hypothetical protein